jgi:hypothetical protein
VTACALVAVLMTASVATAAPPQPRIVSPANGSLVTGSQVRLTVSAPGARQFQAWLGLRSITRQFSRRGNTWVASLARGSLIRAGVNYLYVRTAGGGFAVSRFVLGRGSFSSPRLSAQARGPVTGSLNVTTGRLPAGGVTRSTLNGRGVAGEFQSSRSGRFSATLGADNGLRFGRNSLRLVSFNGSGQYAVQTLSVVVSRRRPLVGAAGPSRGIAGLAMPLDGRSSRASAVGAKLSYLWQVVGSPAGVTLSGANTATPSFNAAAPGDYQVRLTVTQRSRGLRSSATDVVPVTVDSSAPPIGLQTDTFDARGRVAIGGVAVPDTGGSAQGFINLVVVDRETRTVLFHSSEYRASAIDSLRAAVTAQAAGDTKRLVIISGANGVASTNLASFETLASDLGAKLNASDRSSLSSGKPFSLVGVPKAPAGSAFTNFGGDTAPGAVPVGDLSGYLQMNPGTGLAEFAFGDYPSFDTNATAAQNSTAMQVGGSSIVQPLSTDSRGGFAVVVVDRRSLAVSKKEIFDVNRPQTSQDGGNQTAMVASLAADTQPNQMVLVQSYGKPKPTTPEWDKIAQALEKLGATRTVFDELNGTGDYAFVGGPALTGSAIEASGPLTGKPGRVQGYLSRLRDAGFAPGLGDPSGAATGQLLKIAYQPARPFPAFDTPGKQAADRWITGQLKLLGTDVRQNYWINYSANWDNKRESLGKLAYPPGMGFAEPEFTAVRSQLDLEISNLNDIKTYIDHLASPFNPVGEYINLQNISQRIQMAVRPPQQVNNLESGKIIGQIGGAVGRSLPPPYSFIAVGVATAFQFAGSRSLPDFSPDLGPIQVMTSDLGDTLAARFASARNSLTVLGLIYVSDYGKMQAIASKVTSDPMWIYPAQDAPIRASLSKGVESWFYGALMPLGWKLWDVGGDMSTPFATANDFHCDTTTGGKVQHHHPHYVFRGEPATGQYRPIIGFNADMTPHKRVLRALGVPSGFRAQDGAMAPPPASLTDPLFAPADQSVESHKLGLFPEQFYERNFQHYAPRFNGAKCD